MTKPDNDDDQIDDDDAARLLAGDDDADDSGETDGDDTSRTNDGDDDGDPSALRDPGKKALDAMKRERNLARKELAAARAKLKEIDDRDKTETQRLQEAKDEAASRAAKAEEKARAFSIAMERAPEHATLAHVRAVAKRVRGESDEDLEQDADELFELLAPAPTEKKEKAAPDRKVAGRPRERLRGGGDPDDEPEENDPRKLADLIRRR